MIYAGKSTKYIVAQLQTNSTNAIGFGADGNLIQSDKTKSPQ
jgi:acetylglutamate kinase